MLVAVAIDHGVQMTLLGETRLTMHVKLLPTIVVPIQITEGKV